MSSAKADTVSMLQSLPDDSSFEDIQYHLYVLEKVKRGISRAGSERTLSHEDVKKSLAKWLSN